MTAYNNQNKWLDDGNNFVCRPESRSVHGYPDRIFQNHFNYRIPGKPHWLNSLQMLRPFSLCLGPIDLADGNLQQTNISIPRYPTPYPIAGNNSYFRNGGNLNQFAGIIPTTNVFCPFRGNREKCSVCNSKVEENNYNIGLENGRNIVTENKGTAEKLDAFMGVGIETTPPVREKPFRMCYFPYKCNFCSLRFASQHELSNHSTECENTLQF
jgi:hypothetical protein